MNMKKNQKPISELTLQELFGKTLTDTSCVYIDKEREVWVATEMCAQYLESTIDAILVRDDSKPVGIVGGYDLLDHMRKNPTRDFQYTTQVGEIMFQNLPMIDRNTRFGDLMQEWKESRRAFAYLHNESGDYSPISARKMLEVGMRSASGTNISSMPKKKLVTFSKDDSLGRILDLMYENKTRKLILENSNQFISDRLILGDISRILKFQANFEYFLDIPASQLKMEYLRVIREDTELARLCSIMDKMDHPYVLYKDAVVTPWDVCLALESEYLIEPLQEAYARRTCPNCGHDLD
jgi:predicted transcriptional regulator